MKMAKSDSKVCGVCGDKALGCNFNAITCESCKAFFRRNALIQKEFKCPFNNQCEMTTVTRRFCQKCRLDKCFAIGMRKDLIMSDQDKVAKRQKIEENKTKKRSIGGFKSGFKKMKKEMVEPDSSSNSICSSEYDFRDTSFSDQSCQVNSHNNVSVINQCFGTSLKNSDEKVLSPNERLVSSSDDVSIRENTVVYSEFTHSRCEEMTIPTNILANDISCNKNISGRDNTFGCFPGIYSDPQKTNLMEEINPKPNPVTKEEINSKRLSSGDSFPIESILYEAIKLEYGALSSLNKNNCSSRNLNDAERAKLHELIVAHKEFLPPVDDELNDLLGNESKLEGDTNLKVETDPTLTDVINLTAICIKRLIKMAKKINAFKNMCQEDQVALLKGGCTEIMLLRSAMNYDSKKRTWQIPHTTEDFNVNVDILKLAKGNIYQEHEHFIKTFLPKWRSDENIILIMCAIILFTPERPKVVHQDVVKLEQNSYFYLLKRYLESIYPGCEAKSSFLKLIQQLRNLHTVSEELVNVYLNVDTAQVEPLLIEIFDMKNSFR
uniref:Hormone receptor 96 n=1 Tax=Leptinotarsa decemlineata TaxID=7539 RepID=A0A1S5UZQ2_LEPDE|nr:hormone receptor 96 [Leptinotarsa decemlineata]